MARSYDNSRRRAKAEHTRDRILAAAADVIAEGGSLDVSLPAVAAMADVSQPTLFRHFPSKQALFAALAELQFRTLTSGVAPTTVEELQRQLPAVFTRAAAMEPLVRWTLAAGLAGEPRVRPERLEMLRAAIGTGSTDTEAVMIERLVLLLTSPLVAFYWRDYLGLGAEDAAATAAWGIGKLTKPD